MEVHEYYITRLKELGVTEKDCKTVLNYEVGNDCTEKTGEYQFIREGVKGIDIYFFDLHGNIIYFDDKAKEYNRQFKTTNTEYKITRLAEPNGDMKYKFPSGVGETFPWIPPALMQKYKKREVIRTLYLT